MEQYNFNLAIEDMLTFSSSYRLRFLDHESDFTAFDNDFTPPFADSWNTAIFNGLNAEMAETRNDQLQILTGDVEDVMVLARKKAGQIKYFVQKGFPNNPKVLGKFGYDSYSRVSQSQSGMRMFLGNLYKQAESATFKPTLLAANCTQAMIDGILTLRDGLVGSDAVQDHFRDSSPLATKQRREVMNTAWQFAQTVRRAAEVVYADDVVMLNLFLFPRRTEDPEVFNIVGNASQLGTGNVVVGASLRIVELDITTTSDADGNFGFAGIVAGSYTLEGTAVGHELNNTPFVVTDPTTPTVVNVVLTPNP